jgi:16S rRNA (adenine1518-N6/adenine1519-N6)-dimethyltransferase
MPLSPTQTRALLEQLGLRPSQRLGQNFLTDGNLVQKSLALAELPPQATVVEIGPGLGTLTAALLEAGAEVFAVELDPNLAQHLRDTLLPAHPGRFHLLEADAVAHPRAGLPDSAVQHSAGQQSATQAGVFSVVSNLPYAISTPWLDALLNGPLPERLVLMLQREAAARFTAAPGTAARGAISIFLDAAFARAASHPVARRCFYPVPRVDSILLSLRRRADARAFRPEMKKFIRALFTQRRKQLGALLRAHAAPVGQPALRAWLDRLPVHGLDARARPEDVPTAAWLELNEAAIG